jgi:hypothetical protein
MSNKLMPRLGSAIASTILSVFSAVSLVGVDKAQAAVLTYNFDGGYARGFFKVNNSSLTGIGYESIAVSEGRLYTFTLDAPGAKEYYDLAGAKAIFAEGDIFGLYASGSDYVAYEAISTPDAPGGTFYWRGEMYSYWYIYYTSFSYSLENSRRHFNYQSYIEDGSLIQTYYEPLFSPVSWGDVSYTLVNTEAEPVPEPLTAGGTALALAGLSWLKHKKKMAA